MREKASAADQNDKITHLPFNDSSDTMESDSPRTKDGTWLPRAASLRLSENAETDSSIMAKPAIRIESFFIIKNWGS